ncbi:MAG TPA: glycosyltransferase family 1 protein [Acidimicrobiales bacterium]|nr:glycosyltransferase family 1 protein [Acidimicrobiales bacterium]
MTLECRVAIDCTPLLGSPTGVGAFVAGALDGLRHATPPVHAVAYALSWRGRGDLAAALPAGVDIAGSTPPAGALLRVWRRVDRPVIEAFTGSVDVVHGTNFVVPPARRAGRVVTVHDLTAWRFPELCTTTTLRYPDLVRRAVDAGALVHTPTDAVADELCERLGVGRERVTAIHHGLGPGPPGDADRGRGVAGAERFVLALGTVEPRKDLPSLVRAFDLVATETDLDLVIAGADGWGAEQLTEAITTSKYGDRIRRIGYVGSQRRADLLAAATVFAYPSRYEGFGLPPLEAMAAGVPVVTTEVPAVVEVVGDAALVVPLGNHESLADAIMQAAGPAARGLIERGRARAAGFSWRDAAKALALLYERAAQRS